MEEFEQSGSEKEANFYQSPIYYKESEDDFIKKS